MEIGVLKVENAKVKQELEELHQQVTTLTTLVEGDPTDDVALENRMLRSELAMHESFIRSLHLILDDERVLQAQVRGRMHDEGAESARLLVLRLLAESARWPMQKVPPEVRMPLPDFEFRAVLEPGQDSAPDRLSLRIDLRVPFTRDPDVVQGVFFQVFKNEKLSQRLQMAKPEVKLTCVDAPSHDTELILFRHDKADDLKETLFVLNRKLMDMAKTTLLVANPNPDDVGTIDVRLVAMTSTAMYDDESLPQQRAPRLSSMVIKGVVCWAEEAGVRISVVYSVPEDYNIVDNLTFDDVLKRDPQPKSKRPNLSAAGAAAASSSEASPMSTKFAIALANVLAEFEKVYADSMSSAPAL